MTAAGTPEKPSENPEEIKLPPPRSGDYQVVRVEYAAPAEDAQPAAGQAEDSQPATGEAGMTEAAVEVQGSVEAVEVVADAVSQADDSIEARIARKIREDSELRGRPTLVDDLETLFRDDDPNVNFDVMQADERYQDIKLALAPAGTLYIYSDQHLSEADALGKSAVEEVLGKVAERVRTDSRRSVKLTKFEDLAEIAPDLSADSPLLTQMAEDERYSDIATIAASTGATFLFSESHITRNYATILARAEAKDPLAQIAETVREESKIYPRPTCTETFTQAVFGLEPHMLEEYVAQLLQSPDYPDIKQVVASNGAVYLHSTNHLSEAYAKSLAEWDAVEQWKNQ